MKKGLISTIVVVCAAVLCLGQVNDSLQQKPLQQAGQDDFGRSVEPVGAPVRQPQPVSPRDAQAFDQMIKDVYFDFDRADLTADDVSALRQNAEWLKVHPEVTFTIEGDADQRGSIPYNLFLSDERALATRDELLKLGVPEKQILFATGWGKLYPVCQQEDELCWSKQRRAHFAPWATQGAAATSAQSPGDRGLIARTRERHRR
jgi:outer membrane protein OmpA-like peptidoglycan-associated protein